MTGHLQVSACELFNGPSYGLSEPKAHSCAVVDCTAQSFTPLLGPTTLPLDVGNWKHVTWSDESRFQLYRTNARKDNATPHASRDATKWLQERSSDFRHFHWPPKPPEINIIEDIRDALLYAVEKRPPPPRTPMDLLTAL
ncbi:hypothetical protein AVEN_212490-1 [Araneus ventricosus]|uniref:Tc1-like transposase DDE domain-containing protein n=1 Tax=Araneus ventricosus TaxID=182803 RepID=A0A4Y2K183_ARAVE|nr:hypothetical protein AVEN_212490-1 [Araneus ventricosus]